MIETFPKFFLLGFPNPTVKDDGSGVGREEG